ncbi:MAG: PilW family protein [Aquisalimonadaceae bacterium]
MSASVEHRQHGLSLVELLVAMGVSLILLAGVLQIFVGNRQTANTQDALSQIQESIRFASHFLSRDVREAGYRGCSVHGPLDSTLKHQDSITWDLRTGLEGYDNVGATLPPRLANAGIAPLPGSDVIVVRAADGGAVPVAGNNNGSQLFAVNTGVSAGGCAPGKARVSGLCEGDVVMVSNCRQARVFQITSLAGNQNGGDINIVHSNDQTLTPGNAFSSWGGAANPNPAFGADSEIVPISTRIYYLATGADGEPALFRRAGNAAAEELVSGIEDMQILYGVDSSGNAHVDDYTTADGVSGAAVGSNQWHQDWQRVLTARFSLLLRAPRDGVVESPQLYAYNGATGLTAPDHRLRQVSEFTVTLRNRAR